GGTDQKFNLLVGRELQRHFNQKPQVVLTVPLLVGIDGTQKMSKSLGNAIALTDPPKEMYGKLLKISDDLMWNYLELLSDLSLSEIAAKKKAVEASKIHPKSVKMQLALELTQKYHGEKAAFEAQEEFERVFSQGGLPDEVDEVVLQGSESRADAGPSELK